MKKLFTLAFVFTFSCIAAQPLGWLYNLPIDVQNPNNVNAVDYQMRLTINTQSLISAGKMTPTGSDIRFGGNCTPTVTLFNYWIESGINTASTVIWVKIPLIAANSTTTIIMFHGNATAPAVSAVLGTFRGPNSSTDSVSGGTSGGVGNSQRGFRFQPIQNLLVTHFGKMEPTGSTRYVTLFDFSTQAIISQTQVPGSGTTTYSYGPISSPIWLTTGTQYVLQLFQGASDGYYYGSSSQIGQHLTYLDMRYCNSCTQNTFPTSVLANYHYGYPDFLYFIATTLAITPTYTFGTPVGIFGPSGPICSGNSVTLTTNATGSYTWNTGATSTAIVVAPTSSVSYYVTQSNNAQTCNFYLIVNTSPTVTATGNVTVCLGGSVSLTASGVNSYTWSTGLPNGASFSPTVNAIYTVVGANACGTAVATSTVIVAPLPIVCIASSSVICSGSTATLSTAGATTYTWLPGNIQGANIIVSPTSAVVYTVNANSGSCIGSNTLALATNPLPTVSASASSSMVCSGDPVTLVATGGLTYTWMPGSVSGSIITVNAFSSTSFSVGGTNSFGCSSGASQVILVNPNPTVSATANFNLICVGDPVLLSASGASTYSWSTGATSSVTSDTPASSTVYTITGTTSGCVGTQTVAVSVFNPVVSVSGQTAICSGTTANLSASGADTYSWSTGSPFSNITVSPTVTTIYTVSAFTSSGSITCPSSNTIQVSVGPTPTVTAAANRTTICKGESVDLVASGANVYLWSNSATTPSITITPSLISTFVYTVIGTNAQNCSNTATAQVKVNACTGLTELTSGNTLVNIYPNPNNGNFAISYTSDVDLTIVSELGQVVKKISLNASNNYTITISTLAKGVYFITGRKDNSRISQKIIVD